MSELQGVTGKSDTCYVRYAQWAFGCGVGTHGKRKALVIETKRQFVRLSQFAVVLKFTIETANANPINAHAARRMRRDVAHCVTSSKDTYYLSSGRILIHGPGRSLVGVVTKGLR